RGLPERVSAPPLRSERMFLLLQTDSFSVQSSWGICAVIGSCCNKLPRAGYKQVFGANVGAEPRESKPAPPRTGEEEEEIRSRCLPPTRPPPAAPKRGRNQARKPLARLQAHVAPAPRRPRRRTPRARALAPCTSPNLPFARPKPQRARRRAYSATTPSARC